MGFPYAFDRVFSGEEAFIKILGEYSKNKMKYIYDCNNYYFLREIRGSAGGTYCNCPLPSIE